MQFFNLLKNILLSQLQLRVLGAGKTDWGGWKRLDRYFARQPEESIYQVMARLFAEFSTLENWRNRTAEVPPPLTPQLSVTFHSSRGAGGEDRQHEGHRDRAGRQPGGWQAQQTEAAGCEPSWLGKAGERRLRLGVPVQPAGSHWREARPQRREWQVQRQRGRDRLRPRQHRGRPCAHHWADWVDQGRSKGHVCFSQMQVIKLTLKSP